MRDFGGIVAGGLFVYGCYLAWAPLAYLAGALMIFAYLLLTHEDSS